VPDAKADAKTTSQQNPGAAAGQGQTPPGALVVIKKYANRRLYNTETSSYVTLEHLSEMVREGRDFIVQDAKTGEDITRSVLTQIIFEQENSGGQTLLPVQFLRRLIRFYGDQMQSFVPSYLEASIEAFAKGQEQWRDQVSRAWGGAMPIAAFEEQARQNMQMFEQAMRMWTPFTGAPFAGAMAPGMGGAPIAPGFGTSGFGTSGFGMPGFGGAPASKAEGGAGALVDEAEALNDLRRQMEAMQKQLDQLTQTRKA
jgi:polyhydroxyalkanoate synthesis repressor PhaR